MTDLIFDFPGVPNTVLAALTADIPNAKHQLLAGVKKLEVIRHEAGLVFKLDEGARGFTFYRHRDGSTNDVEAFRAFLSDPVVGRYMPVTYQIQTWDPTAVKGVLANYERRYGTCLAAKVDSLLFTDDSKHLLTLLIPKEIVRAMVSEKQGELLTMVRGPAASLRALPLLAPLVAEDAADSDMVSRGFVTTYQEGGYQASCAIHWGIVREVIRAAGAGAGICIGPVATWTP
jgi:hypothetical protein